MMMVIMVIKKNKHGWYVDSETRIPMYLHWDGVWRRSTYHNEVFSGYFVTKSDAKSVVKKSEPFLE